MSRGKSKASRRAKEAKHVRLYIYMLKTEAWLTMTCQARCLLIELQALYNGTNNGELFMSVRTAAKLLNTGMRQARAAFSELAERGFIRATRKGGMTRRGEERLATCWRLTEHDDDLTGREPTKEFMTWRAGEKNSTVAPEATHRSPRGHGTGVDSLKRALDRGPRGHGQAAFAVTTVAPEDTQLVNHPITSEKQRALLQTADPSARPDGVQQSANRRPWRKPSYVEVDFANYPHGRKFGPWLGEARNRLGIQVREMADAIGMTASDLFALESGRIEVGRVMQRKFVDGLRASSRAGPRL